MRGGKELPMQMMASEPAPGVFTSLGRVIQLPSSMVQSKKACSLLLSHLVFSACFNILSEKSQEVREKAGRAPISSINMTESTPVPAAASRIVKHLLSFGSLMRKFL